MTRIERRFKLLKRGKRKAFIAYITAGDPDLATTARLVPALETSGVDILELGIPFSDPLADGPTIQAASQRALKKGASLKKIFGLVRRLRLRTEIPIVFMTYYNPVLRYGLKRFVKACASNGVDGVIVPDLPYEEARELISYGRKYAVDIVFLAAPTSTKARLKGIVKNSKGFIYYVSLTGVTGARKNLPAEIGEKVKAIKRMTDIAVTVGFGVSAAGQAKGIARMADGVIVGSAIVKVIEKNLRDRDIVSKVSGFARTLAKAIHSA
jgi:tryptophan synthase alpha chain